MNSESKQQENICKWELVILNHRYLVAFFIMYWVKTKVCSVCCQNFKDNI